jgi:uncharacterized protein (AIM24 family)
MNCPHCASPIPAGAQYCQACGAAVGAPAGGATRPLTGAPPASNEPQLDPGNHGTIRVGDLTITIEGDLVPVANVELGAGHSVYFEHHILLWKQPEVSIGVRGRKGMARRFFAGMPIFLSEARGPGNIAVSRESVGQIVALPLGPGESVDVREHQFLLATETVEYGYVSVTGVATALFTRTDSRTGLFLDRFTGMGESGLVLLHGYGNVFEKTLAPGEMLDVEPGAWLWKDSSVRMSVTSIVGSGHGGLVGALGNLMAGISVSLNRFTGPGRIGIQSMTYVPVEQRAAVDQPPTASFFHG